MKKDGGCGMSLNKSNLISEIIVEGKKILILLILLKKKWKVIIMVLLI